MAVRTASASDCWRSSAPTVSAMRRCRRTHSPEPVSWRHSAGCARFRDYDGQLQPARPGPDPQQRRRAAAHVRRAVQPAAGDPDDDRGRTSARGAALPQPRGVVCAHPGIRVVAPATLADARGMLATALEDPDPVVIFEHGSLYNMDGELAAGAGAVDIERAAVRHRGDDVTIVAYGGTLRTALEAAGQLAAEGTQADVIDLRTLRPLD